MNEESSKNPFGGLGEILQSAMTGMQAGPGGEKKEWWHSFRYPETPDFSVNKLMNCARSALFGEALGGGPAVREGSWRDVSDHPKIEEVVVSAVGYVGEFGRLIYSASQGPDERQLFFVFSGGAIMVILNKASVKIELIGTTKAHMQLGKDLLKTCMLNLKS